MDGDIIDPEREDGETESSESDAKGGISADLIRGHINTIILRTLYERDKYGYEIIEEIEAKSHGQYTLKQPTLYSALKRLESQGYINAYWKTDEVSQGGRRKYYTLTDSGREITERNQAEWEYSRTVIDNLISDRNFDFTQPPPAAVDFKILKNSTSRVPNVKDDAEDKREVKYDEPVKEQVVEIKREDATPVVVTESDKQPEPEKQSEPEKKAEPENTSEALPVQTEQAARPVTEPAPQSATEQTETQRELSEEEKQAVHRNYMRLISEPVETTQDVYNPSAGSVDTERLIYNNKPETERDYKNLINNLFYNTLRQEQRVPSRPQPAEEQQQDTPSPARQQPRIQVVTDSSKSDNAIEKALDDGLSVGTAEYPIGIKKKRYNLGAALLKCSLIVSVIMLLEFAMCLIFRNELGVPFAYPFVILAITCAQALIFIVLYFIGVGKSARKPTTLIYLSACLVITIITVLIILVTSLLLNINFSSVGDVMAKIVIPCIVALNIPIFGVLFYFFSK